MGVTLDKENGTLVQVGGKVSQSLLEIGTECCEEFSRRYGEVSVVEGKCIPAVLPAVRVTVRESFLESI